MSKIFPFLFLLLATSISNAQTLSSVIVDSATLKPIPYVTVQLKNKGIITNEEGRFSFQLDNTIQPTDSLFISCIGYASINKPIHQFTDNQIVMAAKAIELNPVIVTNKNYTPEEIIEEVEKNITKNYNLGLTKKRIFLRETYGNRILKTDYTLKKSTIEAFDKAFIDNLISQVPKSNTYYTEVLGDLYGGKDEDEQKLDLIKASELYDKSLELDFEVLEKKVQYYHQRKCKDRFVFQNKIRLVRNQNRGG